MINALIQEESREWFLKLIRDQCLHCTGFHLREVTALYIFVLIINL